MSKGTMEIYPQFRERMSNSEYQLRLAGIRKTIIPYTRRKPKARTRHVPGEYFDNAIAEVLRNIRAMEIDYVFREEQLIELLRYEPDLQVEYLPSYGMWAVFLGPVKVIRERAG